MSSKAYYNAVAEAQRRLPRLDPDTELDLRELVRLGTLAASSHNTQPWLVRIEHRALTLAPDPARRCTIVDPDDSHLFKSLGCMARNIEVSARMQGYEPCLSIDAADGSLRLEFDKTGAAGDAGMFQAIAERQCTRIPYDGHPLATAHRQALEQAGTGDGVRTIMLEGRDQMESIIEFVTRGNAGQLSDPAFKKELAQWIRFNRRAAMRSKDGLAGHLGGHPSLPQWFGKAVLNFVLTPTGQSDTDARNIRSSAAVAVFVANRDAVPAWVETGRVYERFALAATVLGVRNAFINQPIELRAIRPQLNDWLGLDDEQALLMVRLGYGPRAPFSLRRPVDDIIVDR